MALRNQQGTSRPKPYFPVPAVLLRTFSDCHKPHNKAKWAYSPTNAKTADMRNHACRLSYQLYILSNRIVKPNNRYTRQPASHDFPFYSAPDKVYALTATNRIAMRFVVCSAPPFRYRTKRTDNSKGGT